MLKDAEGKREAEIDKLVSRLADTITPLIADHIVKNGSRKPMRLQHEFSSWKLVFDNYEPTVSSPKLGFFRRYRVQHRGKLAGYLSVDPKDRVFCYSHVPKENNILQFQLTIPVDEIVARLVSLYRKSGFILDIATIVDGAHHFAFNIRLRRIQVSDKPKRRPKPMKTGSKSNGVAKAKLAFMEREVRT
ncbi:uncharacterized protein METZ01_LOCUS208495 [marine metagenome]|uniref:Uncharacterized protein n=1 Tax=marine metagenome TaxID=408172 RepID=A0A382F0I5_9ZZZZ